MEVKLLEQPTCQIQIAFSPCAPTANYGMRNALVTSLDIDHQSLHTQKNNY